MKYNFTVTKFEWCEINQAHAVHFKMNTFVNTELHECCYAYITKQAAVNWLNSNRFSWFMFMFEDWLLKTTAHFSPNLNAYELLVSDAFCTPREMYLQNMYKTYNSMHQLQQTTPLLKLLKCLELFCEHQAVLATFIKNIPKEHSLHQNILYLFNWANKIINESKVLV